MCSIGLNFEYSRMHVPSLSSGCEIAQFFVRYMAVDTSKSAIFFSPHWSQHEDDTMLVTNTIIPNPAWLFSETSFHTWTYTPLGGREIAQFLLHARSMTTTQSDRV